MQLTIQMRKDIITVLDNFITRRYNNILNLPKNRYEDINHIKRILCENDPLIIRNSLLNYLNIMSKGIITFIPFLEVNQLKYAIKAILDQPHYQEVEILKAMLKESKPSVVTDNFSYDVKIHLCDLEQKISMQSKRITKLDQEVQRLTIENQFLCQTIQLLSKKNQEMAQKNFLIHDQLQRTIKEYDSLNDKYHHLLQENQALKQQLQSIKKSNHSINCENNFSQSKKTEADNNFAYKSFLLDHASIRQEINTNRMLKRRQSIA